MRAPLSIFQRLAAVILGSGALLIVLPANTYGDPPPWAPAHGWRKQNDPHYVGYTVRNGTRITASSADAATEKRSGQCWAVSPEVR